jgi:hypothetical protein
MSVLYLRLCPASVSSVAMGLCFAGSTALAQSSFTNITRWSEIQSRSSSGGVAGGGGSEIRNRSTDLLGVFDEWGYQSRQRSEVSAGLISFNGSGGYWSSGTHNISTSQGLSRMNVTFAVAQAPATVTFSLRMYERDTWSQFLFQRITDAQGTDLPSPVTVIEPTWTIQTGFYPGSSETFPWEANGVVTERQLVLQPGRYRVSIDLDGNRGGRLTSWNPFDPRNRSATAEFRIVVPGPGAGVLITCGVFTGLRRRR